MLARKMNTSETYFYIRSLGLETLKWLNFSSESHKDFISRIPQLKEFISANRPCLFIWDPKNPENGLKKDFYFNLENEKKIEEWVSENRSLVKKYDYLINTQITNPKDTNPKYGFIGSVFSDGKGNIFGETYHEPGVYNQRLLSRPKKDLSDYLNIFCTGNFKPEIILNGKERIFHDKTSLKEIIDLYGDLRGYFEFMKGVQNNKIGIYTIGFAQEASYYFPKDLFDHYCLNIRGKMNVRLLSKE